MDTEKSAALPHRADVAVGGCERWAENTSEPNHLTAGIVGKQVR